MLRALDRHALREGLALVVQVDVGQLPAGLGDLPELPRLIDEQDAGQGFPEVCCELPAVCGKVQESVDVAEDILAFGFRAVQLLRLLQRNVEGAHRAGLFCGAYHYSYALTPADAVAEARYCKWVIENSGVLLELPIFFDMEDGDGWKTYHGFDFSRRNVTAVCRAFLDEIQPLNAGVYASLSWLEDLIDWRSLNCPIWNAQYYRQDFFKGYMWQYTDRLIIDGQQFDGNILYDDTGKQ